MKLSEQAHRLENKKTKKLLKKIIKHETSIMSMGEELFNECIKISSTNYEKKWDVSILKALKEEWFLNDSINQNDPNWSD